MPDGVTLTAALATPFLAYAGAMTASWVASRADDRLDTWRRREETYRMLRWAVESAVTPGNPRANAVGAAALVSLLDSELLQEVDRDFITDVDREVAGGGTLKVIAEAGDDVQVEVTE